VLATRFVSDDPPESLVTRLATVFRSTDGDIREVLRALFQSPEFWSPKTYDTKFKTPFEYVVSTVRAPGASVVAPATIVQNLGSMGMQPYGMTVPTGYEMKAATWENEGALLARINFATAEPRFWIVTKRWKCIDEAGEYSILNCSHPPPSASIRFLSGWPVIRKEIRYKFRVAKGNCGESKNLWNTTCGT